jgi:hypothetical protein
MLPRLFAPHPARVERWILLLPIAASLTGLIFWFLTAPDPRFAQATLWVSGLNLLLFSLFAGGILSRWRGMIAALLLAGLTASETGTGVFKLIQAKKRFPNSEGAKPDLLIRYTKSGLAVWIPKSGYAPGSSELVSTPVDRFDMGLELRGSSLRDGFRIRP